MGSQWPGMGKQLLQFDVFEKSILQSHRFLENYNINLLNILTDEGSTELENISHCFVGITAIMVRIMNLFFENQLEQTSSYASKIDLIRIETVMND